MYEMPPPAGKIGIRRSLMTSKIRHTYMWMCFGLWVRRYASAPAGPRQQAARASFPVRPFGLTTF